MSKVSKLFEAALLSSVFVVSAVGALALSCSRGPIETNVPDPPAEAEPALDAEAKPISTQKGKAVWYGGKWHGRKTANGEIFDENSMTCAHKKLPFNTIVRVTNLENGKQVTLRVNNRGPYGKGRIVDVSKAAAEKLGMIKRGVVPATVDVMKLPE